MEEMEKNNKVGHSRFMRDICVWICCAFILAGISNVVNSFEGVGVGRQLVILVFSSIATGVGIIYLKDALTWEVE